MSPSSKVMAGYEKSCKDCVPLRREMPAGTASLDSPGLVSSLLTGGRRTPDGTPLVSRQAAAGASIAYFESAVTIAETSGFMK